MNPFVAVLLGVGVALAWSWGKTAKAGMQLDATLMKFQVYKVKLTDILFRITVRFANGANTPLHVQMVNLKCYLDAELDDSGKVTKQGTLIATCSEDSAIEIPASKISDLAFYASMPLSKLLPAVGSKVYAAITGSSSDAIPKNILISGFIKVEGIQIQVNNIIPFSVA